MIKVIDENNGKVFESKCNELLKAGWVLDSSSCGFVNSEEYDFCSSYQAIFVEKEEGALNWYKCEESGCPHNLDGKCKTSCSQRKY